MGQATITFFTKATKKAAPEIRSSLFTLKQDQSVATSTTKVKNKHP